MPNIFEKEKAFRIWSILSITGFEFEGKNVPFPSQHRIVFAYLASLSNRYGDIAASYISVSRKTGINSIAEAAQIFEWLLAYGLIEYIPASLFDGERVKFKYRINYLDNEFPYPFISSALEQ